MPYNPIAHAQPKIRKNRVEHCVKRNNGALLNKITHLPAQTAVGRKAADTLDNDIFLLFNILIKPKAMFVLFANVVRW
jgi:hypothetical protein